MLFQNQIVKVHGQKIQILSSETQFNLVCIKTNPPQPVQKSCTIHIVKTNLSSLVLNVSTDQVSLKAPVPAQAGFLCTRRFGMMYSLFLRTLLGYNNKDRNTAVPHMAHNFLSTKYYCTICFINQNNPAATVESLKFQFHLETQGRLAIKIQPATCHWTNHVH